MKIAIVDYQAGNVGSIRNALNRLGASDFIITSDPEIIINSQAVIFPGQGRAGPAMQSLRQSGLDKVLPRLTQPFLGICLGMQLLGLSTEEDNSIGLGVVNATTCQIQTDLTLPQIGWNKLEIASSSQLLAGISESAHVYFANSYSLKIDQKYVSSYVLYDQQVVASIEQNNFYGIQFHPEKSGIIGEQIVSNFLKIAEAQR